MKDVKVVAMADLIPGKAEKFAARYGIEGCRFYPDHKSLLDNEELDAGPASAPTTPSTRPAPSTRWRRASTVLLEKPMCVTTEEAVEIMRAEKKSGKVLSIGFPAAL